MKRRRNLNGNAASSRSQSGLAFLFDLDGTLVDSVYQDPADLWRHLDEVGVRTAE